MHLEGSKINYPHRHGLGKNNKHTEDMCFSEKGKKMKLKKEQMAVIVLCCMIIAIMPVKKVQAAVYNSTLQFGVKYSFNGEGELQKFDLCLEKSGRVTFNFIAQNSNEETGIYLYDEDENNRMKVIGYTGSYKCNLDLKAGNYVIIFNNSSGSSGNDLNGDPYDNNPAKGTLVANFTDAKESYEENILVTNDEEGVASEIENIKNTNINGQFAINDTVDFYSFNVNKDQKISINYVAPLTSSTIHIYKDTLDLEHWEEKLAAGSHKFTLVSPKRHYYLSIKNDNIEMTGNYTLKFSTAELNGTKLKSVSSSKAKTISVKLGSVLVDKYQIQIATDSQFTQSVKTYTSTTTKKTIKNLKSSKTYYVRVRTVSYANSGAKLYKCCSGWSNVKTVKVK